MYLIDTSLYIHAERDPMFRDALRTFLSRAAAKVLVSSVVIHELLVGVTTRAAREAVVRDVVRPFSERRRIVETDTLVWREAALIVERLAAAGGYADRLKTASFRHDVLIAASCRRVGATLITANRKDFDLIASMRGFRFATALPE
ncbi:MAG TPA: type II toxin-antitoxin system VapC family toxin [Gemmatimonadales bacterium]